MRANLTNPDVKHIENNAQYMYLYTIIAECSRGFGKHGAPCCKEAWHASGVHSVKICTCAPGTLYMRLTRILKTHMESVLERARIHIERDDDYEILMFYLSERERLQLAAKRNSHIFGYLDRSYIKDPRAVLKECVEGPDGEKFFYKYPAIYTLHFKLWKTVVLDNGLLERINKAFTEQTTQAYRGIWIRRKNVHVTCGKIREALRKIFKLFSGVWRSAS
jgi:hypothetical protein